MIDDNGSSLVRLFNPVGHAFVYVFQRASQIERETCNKEARPQRRLYGSRARQAALEATRKQEILFPLTNRRNRK